MGGEPGAGDAAPSLAGGQGHDPGFCTGHGLRACIRLLKGATAVSKEPIEADAQRGRRPARGASPAVRPALCSRGPIQHGSRRTVKENKGKRKKTRPSLRLCRRAEGREQRTEGGALLCQARRAITTSRERETWATAWRGQGQTSRALLSVTHWHLAVSKLAPSAAGTGGLVNDAGGGTVPDPDL